MSDPSILLITSEFPPQPGGIGTHAYYLALSLHKEGYVVTVVTDQRSDIGKEEEQFDANLSFEVLRIKKRSLRFLMYLKRLITTFQNLKRHQIVLASGKFSLWNVSFCNLFFKKKSLAIVHGSEVNFKSPYLKYSVDLSLKQFDGIVAVSHYTKHLIDYFGPDVKVIPNGILIEDWKISKSNQKQLKGSPVLTTVGRVSTRKGQQNVIEHLPYLLNHFPEIHYHCIGIPAETNEFDGKAQALGVASHVTFHGSVSKAVLLEMLSETDVFVMLSQQTQTGDVEGFGIAILEANALGIPAIGAKGNGIEDAIQNGKSGFLVDSKDIMGFEEALSAILKNKEQFKQGALEWAEAHDWKVIVKEYQEVIEELIRETK